MLGGEGQLMDVFVVHHVHELEDESEDVKLIGIYSSEGAAHSAVERLRRQPGFSDTPDGFNVERYGVDEDHWIAGFIRVPRA
jgi:hypothetical protein